jgi:competence ComEA-like helix-hairpin-helix protein
MSWKTFVAGYLHFSRKDRIGVLTLVALILVVYALPYLVPSKANAPVLLNDSLHTFLNNPDTPAASAYGSKNEKDRDFDYGPAPSLNNADFTKGELFLFDPNTLDAGGWRRLGLAEKTARTIINYRSKGGRFYDREDLQKIWGLPDGFYERVEQYISIPPRENSYANRPSFPEEKRHESRAPKIIDINTADTSAWIALPGIGAQLAGRIVNFRTKLGGFFSVEQVGTTYGIPDSTFKKIKPLLRMSETPIAKININAASKEELSKHPYINWKLATAVVAYREQHGPYQTVADLKKIMILDEALFVQLTPYLSVQ